jgi:hypothetical protein
MESLLAWLRNLFAPPAAPLPQRATLEITMNEPAMPLDIPGIIREAAIRYGQDPDTLLAVATIESGLDPKAKNPKSTAGGLFQFLDSTARQYHLVNRYDPAQAADAGARLARDNAAAIFRGLGRAATPGEIYLAHQQGAGGALALLRDPKRLAWVALEPNGKAEVLKNGGTLTMPCAQFAGMWIGKLDKTLARIKAR